VRVKYAAVVQVEQLMLAATLDASDSRTDERAKLRRLEASAQRRMQDAHSHDGSSSSTRAKYLQRGFNFREFWHRSEGEALTSPGRSTQDAAMDARTQSEIVRSTGARSDVLAARSAGVRRALIVVLLLNALSAAIKIGVGARTGALTVLGAALESVLDMLSNGVGILAVSVASREPDEGHPYGHEKFETLGTLGIVGFLSISCFELLRRSVGELAANQTPPSATGADALLLVTSLAVNGFVVMFERFRGRALGSALLLADAAHTASDILVTLLAIASLALSYLGFVRADALLGILVALIIAWSGYQILRDSIPILVDASAVDAARLSAIVRTIPGVVGVRSARSRRTSSGHLFAEVTILVDGATSVSAAHDFTDDVERAIERELGTAEAIVHVEPA
jgi:cation diffusion facilitator family transporter